MPSPDQIALTNLNFGVGAGNSPWTIEALIRPSNISLNQEIVCTDGHNVRGFQFRISGNQLEFNQIGVAGGNPKFPFPPPGRMPLWRTPGITWRSLMTAPRCGCSGPSWILPSARRIRSGRKPGFRRPASAPLLVPLVIGDENRGGFGEPLRGLIDEVRISNIARAANQMQFFSPAVTISQSPTSQSIDVGQPVTFEVLASSTSALGYQWRYNGAPFPARPNTNVFSLSP
jgi:hypothetical protein